MLNRAQALTLAQRLIGEQFCLRQDCQVRFLHEGMDRFAVVVNGDLVVLFPVRDCQAGGFDILQEADLLDILAPRLSLDVPRCTHRGRPSSIFPRPFIGYHLLPGASLSDHEAPSGRWELVGRQLGLFLGQLHAVSLELLQGVSLPGESASMALERRLAMAKKAAMALRAWLPGKLTALIDSYLKRVVVPPESTRVTLVHNDLIVSNLLYQPRQNTISGVLDWGDAMLSDPAVDMAGLWLSGGETALDACCQAYAALREPAFRARVVFYGHCLAIVMGANLLGFGGPDTRKGELNRLASIFTERGEQLQTFEDFIRVQRGVPVPRA